MFEPSSPCLRRHNAFRSLSRSASETDLLGLGDPAAAFADADVSTGLGLRAAGEGGWDTLSVGANPPHALKPAALRGSVARPPLPLQNAADGNGKLLAAGTSQQHAVVSHVSTIGPHSCLTGDESALGGVRRPGAQDNGAMASSSTCGQRHDKTQTIEI